MAAHTTLTLDQFLSLPEREAYGTHYELSEGELIALSASGYRHGVIVMNIGRILGAALDRTRYIIAGGEAGFILNAAPTAGTIRGADVAVNKRETVGGNPPVGFLQDDIPVPIFASAGTPARDSRRSASRGKLEQRQRLHLFRARRRDCQQPGR